MDSRPEVFQKHRRRLYGIAYRMLGSRLPEPLVGEEETFPSPERHVELASDLSVAFLVLLEQLAPEERAAFLLHDVFDCGYPEIAGILGKNEAACRQVVRRARERVRRDRPRFQVSEAARRGLAEKFVAAMHSADQGALLALFAEDITWTADGGGKAPATTKSVQGASRVAKLVGGFARLIARGKAGAITFEVVPINGEAGVLARRDGHAVMAMSFETDGLRILAGYNVTNPEKLRSL